MTNFHKRTIILFSFTFVSLSAVPPNIFPQTQVNHNSSSYKIIAERNIFRPLWAVSSAVTEDKSRKDELEALKQSEEARKQERAKADLDNKKRELETNYTLTGIVFENGKKQAVIQTKKGLTHFLYENDMLDDLKITSINDSKSEVIADYQGKFTITFHME